MPTSRSSRMFGLAQLDPELRQFLIVAIVFAIVACLMLLTKE